MYNVVPAHRLSQSGRIVPTACFFGSVVDTTTATTISVRVRQAKALSPVGFEATRYLYDCKCPHESGSMTNPQPRSWRIPAAWLTLCVVWSSTWLAIKVGLRDLPPISFVAIRFVIAVALLMAVSIGRVRLRPVRRSDYQLLAFTGLLMFSLNYPLLFWGEKYVSSGLAAVLQATIPIFGMIFAHCLLPNERMRWQRMVGALVALTGVSLICGRLLDRAGLMAFWGGL